MIVNAYKNIKGNRFLSSQYLLTIKYLLDNKNVSELYNIYINLFGDHIIKSIPYKFIYSYFHSINQENKKELEKNVFSKISKHYKPLKYAPSFLKRLQVFYLKVQIPSIKHKIDSLLQEYDIIKRKNKNETELSCFIEDFVNKQMLFERFMYGSQNKHSNVSQIINDQLKRNKSELSIIKTFVKEFGIDLTTHQIYNFQNTIWGVISTNEVIVTNDLNYRSNINGIKGNTHSLYGVENIIEEKFDCCLRDYTHFIEAVSCFRYKNYVTTYGFMHKVVTNEHNIAYQIETPIIMIDNKIMRMQSKYLAKILKFEERFLFNHDLRHHLIPVYADHFTIHHPDAPITYGGYKQGYLNFAKALRKNKEEYEIGLGICQRLMLSEMFVYDNKLKLKQQNIFYNYIVNLKLFYAEQSSANGEDIKDAVEHLLINGINRYLTIFSFNELLNFERDYNIINTFIEELGLGGIMLKKSDLINLLHGVGIVSYKSRDIMLQAEQYFISNPLDSNFALRNALKEMEIFKVLDEGQIEIKGLNKFRWLSIIYPQKKELQGFTERVHGDYIKFGDKYVDPRSLLVGQYKALLTDYGVYNLRTYLKNKHQIIIYQLREVFHTLLQQIEFNKTFLRIIDEKINSLLIHTYQVFDFSEIALILKETSRMNNILSVNILKLIKEYNKICHFSNNYMINNFLTVSGEKSKLVNNLLHLS